jgi:adenine-specific DNA-methyltransferase
LSESPEVEAVAEAARRNRHEFAETGLRISTGPVVMFRATEFLVRDPRAAGSAPLLLPHNIKPFATTWPLGKNGKPEAIKLSSESSRLLLPTGNYVLLKRFSAKEEKRRLVAGCLLRDKYDGSHVGIENYVNYIYHGDRQLSEDEVYGIAAVFNSMLFDRYFRTISGNTQVNATEIRTMKFPDLSILARIGTRIRTNGVELEAIVMDELGTAFLTKADFRRCAAEIAWETEVWIAESPDHMIHFNGPKFLGPYRRDENRPPESARRRRPSQ